MAAKARLVARLDEALALARAGQGAEARALLDRVAADPEVAALGAPTALGLPRKLHSARVRVAKIGGDAAEIAGLRATAVPPAAALADLFRADAATRAAHVAASGQPVPHCLHQIWVGGPPPAACAVWADYARRHGWTYRLWDAAALAAAGVTADPLWQAMIAAGDLPGAVDVARYHILLAEGGLYLDCDWYPARPDLPPGAVLPLHGLSALAEAVPRLVAGEGLLLSNALIATPPGHPALARLRATLPEVATRLAGGPAWWVTGPLPFTLAARGGPVTVLDPGMVADNLARNTSLDQVQARAADLADGPGFLIAWKGW